MKHIYKQLINDQKSLLQENKKHIESKKEITHILEELKNNINKIIIEGCKKAEVLKWLNESEFSKEENKKIKLEDLPNIMNIVSIKISLEDKFDYKKENHKNSITITLDFPNDLEPEHQIVIECDINGKILYGSIQG